MSLNFSRVGLGTFPFANVFREVTQSDANLVVSRYLAGGGNYIETAPSYPVNKVDLGQLLAQYKRNQYLLGTKCVVGFDSSGQRCVSGAREFIKKQVEEEINRLRCGYIDLLQTHLTPSDVPIAQTVSMLRDLKAAGTVRSIGVSNVSLAELQSFNENRDIEWVQIRLSMVHRSEYLAIRDYCVEHQIRINAFQVIERGQLLPSDSYDMRRPGDLRQKKQEYTGDADTLIRLWFKNLSSYVERNFRCPADAIALAWALAQPAVDCCVVGATRGEQITEMLKAQREKLSPAAMQYVENQFQELEIRANREFGKSLAELRGVVR